MAEDTSLQTLIPGTDRLPVPAEDPVSARQREKVFQLEEQWLQLLDRSRGITDRRFRLRQQQADAHYALEKLNANRRTLTAAELRDWERPYHQALADLATKDRLLGAEYERLSADIVAIGRLVQRLKEHVGMPTRGERLALQRS